MTERTIQPLPIASIDRDGQNHRLKTPGDKEAIRLLSESINQHDQLSPVAVLHLPDRNRYLLIFGFRRVAAVELLGGTEIVAEVFTDLDPATVMQMRAIENLDRLDLNPIEEAVAVAQLLDAAGGDVAKCAATVGRSESWVRDRCYLQRLGKKTRQMVIDGELLLGHAREIAKIADADEQETLAGWCKLAADGTCPMRLSQLRRAVEERMNSLRGVSWDLTVDFAGKPACVTCPLNSTNDRNLFEHDEPDAKKPEGFCMSPGCYQIKTKAAQKALEKAVNKIVNQGVEVTAKVAEKAAPDFLKPARVVREVKKARGEDVEREGKPVEVAEVLKPTHSAHEIARADWQKALGKWEETALNGVIAAAHAYKRRLIALILLGETAWASGQWNEELHAESLSLLEAAKRCDLDGLIVEVARNNYEPPIMSELPPDAVSILATNWGVELPAKPTFEDFLKPNPPGAEDTTPLEPETVAPAEEPEPSQPPAVEEGPHHETEAEIEARWREAAKGATVQQLEGHLEKLNAVAHLAEPDALRKRVIEAELASRGTMPDGLDSLDLSDALAAKLRRHNLLTIDAICAAGGEDFTKLADLGAEEDRFGPREVTAIRMALAAREKQLASHVVGPASDEVHELTER